MSARTTALRESSAQETASAESRPLLDLVTYDEHILLDDGKTVVRTRDVARAFLDDASDSLRGGALEGAARSLVLTHRLRARRALRGEVTGLALTRDVAIELCTPGEPDDLIAVGNAALEDAALRGDWRPLPARLDLGGSAIVVVLGVLLLEARSVIRDRIRLATIRVCPAAPERRLFERPR